MIISQANIVDLNDDQLLETRICDFRIPLRQVELIMGCYQRLRQELKRSRLRITPKIWFADEWYSPDGVCGFAVPFYLMHPRLIRIAAKYLFEVEGSEKSWCMKLMRHEMGHVMDNAFRLRRRRLRQKLFGLSSVPYPNSYSPTPYHLDYVRNLDSWYAQAHPDEDWSETFAVWLNPQSHWREKYRDGMARKKLDYMNEVMKSIQGVVPYHLNKEIDLRSREMKQTLGEFLREKRSEFQLGLVGYFDEDLKRIFSFEMDPIKPILAANFIENNHARLTQHVYRWTGHEKQKVKQIIDHLVERCHHLEVYLRTNTEDTMLGLTAMLSAKVTSYLSSGHYRIAL